MVRSNGNERTFINRRVRTISVQDAPAVAELLNRSGPVTDEFARSSPALLQRLISEEMLNGVAVEYVYDDGSPPEPAAFGLSAFLSEACTADYLASPSPHVALLLLHQALQGRGAPPFLNLQETAQANAGDGLTLSPLCWLQSSYDKADPEAHALLAISQQTLLRRHLGYRVTRIFKEMPAVVAGAFFGGGFRQLRHFPAGTPVAYRPDAVLAQDSIVFIISKEDLQGEWPGTAIGQMFLYREPRCAFTHVEQQVLIRAADGMTDARIAQDLGVTLTAVTLRWRSIYKRVAEHAPSVIDSDEVPDGARGYEKRRLVIAFVSDHPEELRPYAAPARRRGKTIG